MNATRRLDDVCLIIMGQAPNGDAYNNEGNGWPLIAGAGDFDGARPMPKKFTTEASKLTRREDIVLGIRASIGAKVLADGEYCLGRGVAALRPLPALDRKFLWNWLTYSAPELARKGKGATFKQVNRDDIGELPIWVPPLPAQRRIAEVLDRVDALRAQRRVAISLLDGLAQSIFLDMFGDPSVNPLGWNVLACQEICARVTVGIVFQPASHYRDTGVPALRSLNVRPNHIQLDSLVYFSHQDNNASLAKTRVWTDDVVLVRTGRPGTAAVVPPHLDGANAIDILITTPDKSRVDAKYLCSYFNSPTAKKYVLGHKRGQIQEHLNVGSLKRAPVPLPPLELQQEFARRLHAVETLKVMHQANLAELDALFAALQHRAFRGELWEDTAD